MSHPDYIRNTREVSIFSWGTNVGIFDQALLLQTVMVTEAPRAFGNPTPAPTPHKGSFKTLASCGSVGYNLLSTQE